MFVPPDLPEDQSSSSVPLKTILMWGGLAQWGGVKGGRWGRVEREESQLDYNFRGEFLKRDCPVSTCALTNDRNKKETADLILFKVLN